MILGISHDLGWMGGGFDVLTVVVVVVDHLAAVDVTLLLQDR